MISKANTSDFRVLGLTPSTNLIEKEITKAYRLKALELHPDKRPKEEQSIALLEFQNLNLSYEKVKQWVHDHDQDKKENLCPDNGGDVGSGYERKSEAKRKRRASEMDERERERERELREREAKKKDVRTLNKLKEEIANIRAIAAECARRQEDLLRAVLNGGRRLSSSPSDSETNSSSRVHQGQTTFHNLDRFQTFENSILDKCRRN